MRSPRYQSGDALSPPVILSLPGEKAAACALTAKTDPELPDGTRRGGNSPPLFCIHGTRLIGPLFACVPSWTKNGLPSWRYKTIRFCRRAPRSALPDVGASTKRRNAAFVFCGTREASPELDLLKDTSPPVRFCAAAGFTCRPSCRCSSGFCSTISDCSAIR